jgi:hypothetical protein
MTESDQKIAKAVVDRRSFFRAGGGVAMAAAAAVLPTQEAEATESQAERTKARYSETDHVKAFYRVNRY